jgi:uncharacterized membrane protein
MRTVERTRDRTAIDRRQQSGGLVARSAGPGWVIMTLFSVYIAGYGARYLSFDPNIYFAEQRVTYLQHEVALAVHVTSGALALLIGPFQFVRRLRRRYVRVHRVSGAVYIASATVLGLSGLILAPTAYTGPVASLGFTMLGLATLFTTWTALRMVWVGRYDDHRRWMIRSFSLIWGGVMLRIWVPVYLGFSAVGLVDVTFETAYATITWLCWVPNLLIALWFTRRPARPAPAT